MTDPPRRGEIWSTGSGVDVLVISSSVYNEIRSEPTVVVVPVFTSEPATGFGVPVVAGWAAPGLVTGLRKAQLLQRQQLVDVQILTDVNNMLFKILATPAR